MEPDDARSQSRYRRGMTDRDPRAERSRLAVLDALGAAGPLTREQLQDLSGLAPSTVSAVVAALKAEGRVHEEVATPTPGQRRGRPASRIALSGAKGVVVGVAAGHETVEVLVGSTDTEHLARRRVVFAAGMEAGKVLDLATSVCLSLLEGIGRAPSEVLEVVIAVPAPVDPSSGRVPGDITVVPTWRNTAPAQLLAARLGCPVTAVNDANAAALMECRAGGARGARDAIYIECTRGLGGAVILDGRIHPGSDGRVGEIGHVRVPGASQLCVCGQRGCLESEVSTVAMAEKLRAIGVGTATPAGLEEVLVSERGNSAVGRLLHEAGVSLGMVLASMCNLLAPERVVLGGELAAGGEALRVGVVESINRYSLAAVAGRVETRLTAMGTSGPVLGAVALAANQVYADRHSAIGHRTVPLPSAPGRAGRGPQVRTRLRFRHDRPPHPQCPDPPLPGSTLACPGPWSPPSPRRPHR